MRAPVIGIAGKAHTGKDTVAGIWQKASGFCCAAYADPVRMAVAASLGMDLSEYLGLAKAQRVPGMHFTRREAEQTLGTEWARGLDPDYWVKVMRRRVAVLLRHRTAGIVITDVRFDNEAEQIRRDFGGVIVHLHRPDAPATRAHVSERGVTAHAGDLHLSNRGSLGDLEVNALQVLDDALAAWEERHRG